MRIDVIAPPGTAFRPAATAALSGGALLTDGLTDRGRQVTLSAPGSETEARLGPHWGGAAERVDGNRWYETTHAVLATGYERISQRILAKSNGVSRICGS